MASALADRLQKIAGRQTLRLTHYGRKTGQPYQVTIWFIVDGEKIWLATANRNRNWVKNVQKTPLVILKVGSETFEGKARFLSDPAERGRVLAMVRRKYWMFLPFMALGALLYALRIMPNNTGALEVRITG
ncbi:MAG: nitroreductase family deazaflavin-dependent oxidoreductase [Acidobacteriia bacterium]|nr:nitroreductase family deazaflavin-dependent oxidoreductase [Terriglobia bacterium]